MSENPSEPEGVADPKNDPQTRPDIDAQEAAEDEHVRENAETSLDQPSDNVE